MSKLEIPSKDLMNILNDILARIYGNSQAL